LCFQKLNLGLTKGTTLLFFKLRKVYIHCFILLQIMMVHMKDIKGEIVMFLNPVHYCYPILSWNIIRVYLLFGRNHPFFEFRLQSISFTAYNVLVFQQGTNFWKQQQICIQICLQNQLFYKLHHTRHLYWLLSIDILCDEHEG